MLEGFGPLLVYLGLVTVVGAGAIAASIIVPRLLGVSRANPVKLEAYECGVPAFTEGARGRFHIRFYLLAILFIIFDVEVVFLIPWAIEHQALGPAVFLGVLVFVAFLVIGYAYDWKRGALEWE